MLVLGYSAALALFTPPSEDDALTYHLIRSAFWKQDHAVGWVHDTIDLRANVSPPVAEIAVAASMVLDQGERFVALPQLTALPVAGLAVYGIGRRIGLGRRAAALGGLAVPLLPDGLIQSSTAMNDVVPAALTAAIALFVLRAGAADVAVAAIALALLLGTKTAAVFVLPSLALLVLATTPARRWLALAAVGLAAVAVGSAWYVVNEVETGDASGGLDSEHLSNDGLDPVAALARLMRYATSAIELPGGIGLDKYLYVVAGVVLVVVALALRRRALLWSGVLVGAVPLVLVARRARRRAVHARLVPPRPGGSLEPRSRRLLGPDRGDRVHVVRPRRPRARRRRARRRARPAPPARRLARAARARQRPAPDARPAGRRPCVERRLRTPAVPGGRALRGRLGRGLPVAERHRRDRGGEHDRGGHLARLVEQEAARRAARRAGARLRLDDAAGEGAGGARGQRAVPRLLRPRGARRTPTSRSPPACRRTACSDRRLDRTIRALPDLDRPVPGDWLVVQQRRATSVRRELASRRGTAVLGLRPPPARRRGLCGVRA